MIGNVEKKRDPIRNPDVVINDYRIAFESRQVSLIGRREVLSGKAKFGIFGDGKEVAQVAMAHAIRPGDWRAGYYRDQTLFFALGNHTYEEYFAQLYAHPDLAADPMTAGRSMNAHFVTRSLNPDGSWRDQTAMFNSSADVSPTAAQMPRLVGLAYASRLYRELETLQELTTFSQQGNEVAFGTIGNASCAEGMFWEAINAIGVLRAPAVVSIWDDGYGISVTNELQLTKDNLAEMLSGFQRDPNANNGFDVYTVRGWDYRALVNTYLLATENARRHHIPAIIHVTELTQPQGHSTSGSQERYKSAARLQWEQEHDCLPRMRAWMIANAVATEAQLAALEETAHARAEEARLHAWRAFLEPQRREAAALMGLLGSIKADGAPNELARIVRRLKRLQQPIRKELLIGVRDALLALRHQPDPVRRPLIDFRETLLRQGRERYSSHLYSASQQAARHVVEVAPIITPDSPNLPGHQVLNACFDAMLARDPRVIAFGEDLGLLGGVNQAFAGLQEKYGPLRVSDTGIREASIVGQAIGMALRGLRPIAEIQYLDYIYYALQILSDDLATLQWRTKGGQKAPVIIRTRGHRLEGIWHSGSPMGGIIGLVRGIQVLVPRDMTRAAGFYNTLLASDEPGIVVEVLNGYRLRERLPANIGSFTVPLGVPEVVRSGEDVTIVTYGAMVRLALEAATLLARVGIDVEVVDVQSLLPFDTEGRIVASLRKTSRILFLDEDVPGGATAFMLQQVIEQQGGYTWLDAEPATLAAQEHRPAYGTDGDYWSKPNVEQIFAAVYEIMNEADPATYPRFLS